MKVAQHALKCRPVALLVTAWIVTVFAGCAFFASTAPPPAKPAAVEKPRRPIKHRLETIAFTIQVGAFATERNAARYARRLQQQGLDSYHFIDTDGLHKVRFERFSSKEAARDRAETLRARGVIEVFYIARAMVYDDLDSATTQLRADLLKTAHRFIGTRYQWGGTSAETGLDCSGLTQTVYRLNGLDLPRSARQQYQEGDQVAQAELAQGDLLFFDTNRRGDVSHVGIYRGDNTFIHAPGRGKRIQVASLSETYFRQRYLGARRYF